MQIWKRSSRVVAFVLPAGTGVRTLASVNRALGNPYNEVDTESEVVFRASFDTIKGLGSNSVWVRRLRSFVAGEELAKSNRLELGVAGFAPGDTNGRQKLEGSR